MFDRSHTRFHVKKLHKSGATFSLSRVESVYYREIRSSMVRTCISKTSQGPYKSYDPAASQIYD